MLVPANGTSSPTTLTARQRGAIERLLTGRGFTTADVGVVNVLWRARGRLRLRDEDARLLAAAAQRLHDPGRT